MKSIYIGLIFIVLGIFESTSALRIKSKDDNGDEEDVEMTIQEMSQLAEDPVTPIVPAEKSKDG